MNAKTACDVLIAPGRGGLGGALVESWQQRELLYFLAWRDVKVRYKQTVLGVAWALLQPLVTMVVFTLVFHKLGRINAPKGMSYMVFAYAGLLPWLLFQSSLVQSSNSIVAASNLLTKVYFPRLLAPLSSVVSGLLDLAISLAVLAGLMVAFKVPVHWGLVCLPGFVLLAVLAALSVGIWLAALNAKYRDFRYVVPFLAQLGMFLSPVAYASADICRHLPPWGQWLYNLNPMVGAVEGFRWALLGQAPAAPGAILVSTGATLVVLLGGLFFFRRTERVFADLL